MKIFKNKIFRILGSIVVIFIAACIFFALRFQPAKQFTWGINFSPTRAEELGFNPKDLYRDILADLKPKKIRLVAYWNHIEPKNNVYDFSQLDTLVKMSDDSHVQLILVMGRKEPRWPECHAPQWVQSLSAADQNQAEMDMIKTVIAHYKNDEAIKIWQIENEPLFGFGGVGCEKIKRSFLKQEVALIHSLDNRPVLTTDSGEFGRWLPTATVGADLFGSTMYRVVYDPKVGYFKYPLPTVFFHIKAGMLKTFTKFSSPIGVELQAEPWLKAGVAETDLSTQKALMNPKVFADNINYAKKAGFAENYLWGVEWWYWMAKKQGDFGMWAAAKNLLAD